MNDRALEILEQQLQKLDEPGFDLGAWKSQTLVLLGRIFGERSDKTEQLRNIHYDFSSWNLRDTRGKASPLQAATKSARELLEAAITELKEFGAPADVEANPVLTAIRESLEEHFKISAYRKLTAILKADISPEKKREEIRDILRDADTDVTENFFLSLFSNPLLKDKLS